MATRRFPERRPLSRPLGNSAQIRQRLADDRYLVHILSGVMSGPEIAFYSGSASLSPGQRVSVTWREESRLWEITAVADINPPLIAKVGQFTADTVNATQSVTVGFRPKAVIVYGLRDATSDPLAIAGGAARPFMGFSDGVNNVGIGTSHLDASVNTGSRPNDTYSIVILDNETTVHARGQIAFTSTGFEVTWQLQPAAAVIINYIAIAGTSLTDVHVGTFTISASSGAQSVTGVGFEPDCLFWLGGEGGFGTTPEDAPIGNRAIMSFGFSTGPTSGSGWAYKKEDSISDTGVSYMQDENDRPIGIYDNDNSGSTDVSANISSFDADGFTINKAGAPAATYPAMYLALKGGNYFASNLEATPTVTGEEEITGIGFRPRLVVYISDGKNDGSAAASSNAAMTVAAASALAEKGFIGWYGQQGTSGDNAGRVFRTDRMLSILNQSDPTVSATDEDADIDSFDPDGFTLDWTKISATQHRVAYLCLG